MAEWKWRKMEGHDCPFYISLDDVCYYARERLSKGGFKASETNQLIENLKKDPSLRGTPQWFWKGKAVEQCAAELAHVFVEDQQYVVAGIPTSNIRTDPNFDSRIDDVLARLVRLRPLIRIEQPLDFTESHVAQHHRGDNRMKPDEIYQLLRWNGFSRDPGQMVVLFDDVTTCGAHFKACQRLIREHHPGLSVCGVFWAKTIWTPPTQSVA